MWAQLWALTPAQIHRATETSGMRESRHRDPLSVAVRAARPAPPALVCFPSLCYALPGRHKESIVGKVSLAQHASLEHSGPRVHAGFIHVAQRHPAATRGTGFMLLQPALPSQGRAPVCSSFIC